MKITKISFNQDEEHFPGRMVARVRLKGGQKIYYKPHSTTIYLWLISLTASKELSILLLKLYNDGAIGISSLFLDLASAIKTDNQLLIRSVRFMQVESP